MPSIKGKDSKGSYYRWGSKGKKYHYEEGNEDSRKRAKKLADKQGAAAYASGYKGNNMLQSIKANFTGGVHYNEMEGKRFLVAPMIILAEGVHEGSGGALYYPKEEVTKIPEIWNMKPVVVYHPQANGSPVSACDPIILSNRKVGVMMNSRAGKVKIKINNKEQEIDCIKSEAWLEEDRMDKVDERISKSIEKNEMMEVSTGLFTDNESMDGEWNGEAYSTIARNYRPDHLALLPDLRGACSIEDGAGFLRLNALPDKMVINANTLSHGNIHCMLNDWAQSKSDNVLWIETVYDTFFIYTDENVGKHYQREYSVKDNLVSVNDMTATEVIRVTEWRTKDGNKFVGNKEKTTTSESKETVSVENKNEMSSNRKEQIMKKQEMVDAIIACNTNSWGKDDSETLMAMDEVALQKLTEGDSAAKSAVENAAKKGADDATAKLTVNKEEGKETVAETKVTVAPEVKVVENKKPQTAEEYIKEAPAEIQNVMNGMLCNYKAAKANTIKRIIDNEKNIFSQEELERKELPELTKLSALLPGKEEAVTVLNFDGQGDVGDITNNKEEPLIMPGVVNATPKK